MKALVALRAASIATAATVAFAPSARADFNEDQRTCNQASGAPDVRVAACTRQIESGQWEGHNLGVPYNNRGTATARRAIPITPSPTTMKPSSSIQNIPSPGKTV